MLFLNPLANNRSSATVATTLHRDERERWLLCTSDWPPGRKWQTAATCARDGCCVPQIGLQGENGKQPQSARDDCCVPQTILRAENGKQPQPALDDCCVPQTGRGRVGVRAKALHAGQQPGANPVPVGYQLDTSWIPVGYQCDTPV